jgi:hypothetical protein
MVQRVYAIGRLLSSTKIVITGRDSNELVKLVVAAG